MKNKLKMGTTSMGIIIGLCLVCAGALVMVIGFWKTLVLALLFLVGFFVGSVENKQAFMKNAANRIIPEKDAKVIDLKSEIAREQEEAQSKANEEKDGE
jgi:uncharacterized membrane protein